MKTIRLIIPLFAISLTSCTRTTTTQSEVVTKNYYHKYGFEVPKEEWEERKQNGKVVTTSEDGITLVESYEQGILNGETTKTFPNSKVIQKRSIYNDGNLLKELLYDQSGLPVCERDFEFEDIIVKTFWDSKGTPISIEEFKKSFLIEGKYFNPLHEEEATVVSGVGTKIKRNRSGTLLYKETIADGIVTSKITYHPNGNVQSESYFKDEKLHGKQKVFASSGIPLLETTWNEGVLDGPELHYKHGKIAQQCNYINGKKHGLEIFFDTQGKITQEIHWENGLKHGSNRVYNNESIAIEWYFNDSKVTRDKFESLENRSKIIADLKSSLAL